MTKILEAVHALIWGAPALVLILGVGLYLSMRTGLEKMHQKSVKLQMQRRYIGNGRNT